MMKKLLAMVLSLAIVATLAISGTVAYLQDTDEAVNVMTMGEVKIEQIEQKRINDTFAQHQLEEFNSGVKLYPAYYEGEYIDWAPENEWVKSDDQAWKVLADNPNVVDKFITVENTGKSDAYVRTILAVEIDQQGLNRDLLHLVYNGENIASGETWSWEWVQENNKNVIVEINGAYYELFVGTYTGILPSGKTTIPSLKQVYMDKKATNEDVARYGSSVEILAFTQAVQSKGFEKVANDELARAKFALDEAFGEITKDAHPWLNKPIAIPEYVSNANETADAVKDGGNVVVTEDIETSEVGGSATYGNNQSVDYHFGTTGTDAETTLDLGGNDWTPSAFDKNGAGNPIMYFVADGAKVTLKNVGKVDMQQGSTKFVVCGGATLNIMDGEYEWYEKNSALAPCFAIDDSVANVKDGTSTINIHGGSFDFSKASTPFIVYNNTKGEINIYNGTFKSIATSQNLLLVQQKGEGTLNIYGGTFDCDVSAIAQSNANVKIHGTVTQNNNGTWTVSPSTNP